MMIHRRKFLTGSASIATALGTSGISALAADQRAIAPQKKALVYLFLRGGIDGLNLVIPRTGDNRIQYESKRPSIQVPAASTLNLNDSFGLHASATGLKQLFDQNQLAVIHAVGMPEGLGSRSHFDSQEMYELGTPGELTSSTGWLARYLSSHPALDVNAPIRSLATTTSSPTSLLGDFESMTLDSASSFHPNAGRYGNEHLDTLSQIYSGNSNLDASIQVSIDTINLLEEINLDVPDSYPNTSLADDLGLIAGMLKEQVGLQVATVDYGGWDTHNSQGNNGGGYFADHIQELSEAISAFMQDLQAHNLIDDVVLVVQSDFGRRVRENGNQGTDHGTAHPMLVVGGKVQGGQVLGTFPGLRDEDLYLSTDLKATTDFRQVLSDVVVNYLKNPNIDIIFPGYTGATSIGIMDDKELFADGFE